MQLLNINGIDFTHFITVPSYKVNRQNEYIEWQDANFIVHRFLTRTRVSGTCTMMFDDKDEYYTFLDTVEENKVTAGYIPGCTIYCDNIHETVLADLYIDLDPPEAVPLFGSKHEGFEITITER